MFGPSIFSVFRSRWKAAVWALGILITAWSIVPAADDDGATPDDTASAAAAAMAGIADADRMLAQQQADSAE